MTKQQQKSEIIFLPTLIKFNPIIQLMFHRAHDSYLLFLLFFLFIPIFQFFFPQFIKFSISNAIQSIQIATLEHALHTCYHNTKMLYIKNYTVVVPLRSLYLLFVIIIILKRFNANKVNFNRSQCEFI